MRPCSRGIRTTKFPVFNLIKKGLSNTLMLGLFLTISQASLAQTFQLQKTVSANYPYPGDIFSYIINASCNSSISDCESVVITDALPPEVEFVAISEPLPDAISSATYDPATHTVTALFDAANCGSCTPDGLNTDEDDFAQGSSVQLVIQVRFPFGTFHGVTADNEAIGTSDNAGNPTSAASTVTSTGGTPPQTGCAQQYSNHASSGQSASGETLWISIVAGNNGFSDVENYMSITVVPAEATLFEVETPSIPGRDHTGSVYYERSDMPGVWILWIDFNYNNSQLLFVHNLGLPPGVEITRIRMDVDTLSGDGSWNPQTLDLWPSSLRMFFTLDDNLATGTVINSCTDYTSTIDGFDCTGEFGCNETVITANEPQIQGGKSPQALGGSYQFHHNQGDQLAFEIVFSSSPINDQPVLGAVLVDILPLGMTYVSHSFAWGEVNIQNIDPVLELETLPDGRQLVRYIWHHSLGNEFVLTPVGGTIGFAIRMVTQIDPNMAPGPYNNDYYYSAASSFQDCRYGSQEPDVNDYFNGYSFEGLHCFVESPLEIVFVPETAGIDSHKEAIGTLDTNYSRFPDSGTTVPGGINNYTISLTNPNQTPVTNLVIVDVFPFLGDTEVLNSSTNRDSEWRPVLASPIIAPAGTTVYYSTVENPCRDELASPSDPLPFPAGCTPAGWTSIAPSDITTVTAIKLDLGSTVLDEGDVWEISWDMRAPVDAQSFNTIAWNSFAFTGINTNTGAPLLPTEPIKVGIELVEGSIPILGDYVWEDQNLNGLQDLGEPGIDGVTVNLYEDSNGNGIAEPGIDMLHAFAVTSEGGQYIFSNFPFGDYFLEFTNYPPGFNPTFPEVGNNAAIDSEFPITEVFTVTSTTDDRDFDFGLFDGIVCDVTADAGIDIEVCEGDTILLTGSGGISYQWGPISSLSDPTIANPFAFPTMNTTYTLIVTDEFGCTDSAEISIEVNEGVEASAVAVSHDYCLDGSGQVSITITSGTGPFIIHIQTESGDQDQFTVAELGTHIISGLDGNTVYCINVIDNNDCIILPP